MHSGFWWGNLRERDHSEDLGIGGRIILRWTFKKWGREMDWIDLAQDRGKWLVIVNAVMKLRVPSNAGNLSEDLLAS